MTPWSGSVLSGQNPGTCRLLLVPKGSQGDAPELPVASPRRYFANEPFADFHRVEGVRGVYIATLINGSFSEENMRSVITFDKGGTWEPLQPPAQTHYGEKTNCEVAPGGGGSRDSVGRGVDAHPCALLFQLAQGCSLHLAQRLSQLLNFQLRRMPILSKESAPGLIIATGTASPPWGCMGRARGLLAFRTLRTR